MILDDASFWLVTLPMLRILPPPYYHYLVTGRSYPQSETLTETIPATIVVEDYETEHVLIDKLKWTPLFPITMACLETGDTQFLDKLMVTATEIEIGVSLLGVIHVINMCNGKGFRGIDLLQGVQDLYNKQVDELTLEEMLETAMEDDSIGMSILLQTAHSTQTLRVKDLLITGHNCRRLSAYGLHSECPYVEVTFS